MANGNQGGGGGGGRMRLPRNLKPDLESVNNMLSDITTKLGSLENAFEKTFQLNVEVSGMTSLNDLERKMAAVDKTTVLASSVNKKLAETLGTLAKSQLTLLDLQKKTEKELKKNKDKMTELNELSKKKQKLQKSGKDLEEQEIKRLKQLEDSEDEMVDSILEGNKALEAQKEAAMGLDSPLSAMAKILGGQLIGAIDKFGTALISLAIDSVFVGLGLIQKGLMKVYDLFERTTKAVGQFNLGLGGTTAGLADARQAAFEVEGEMRSLTGGELGVGLKMWENTSHALGFVGKGFNNITTEATRAGRGLGIGEQAAGELSRTFLAMGDMSIKVGDDMADAAARAGMSTEDFAKKLKAETATAMVSVSDAANAAGVSVADFGKEINGAKGFMATFGKTGEKVFLKAAAYFKKLGVSIQSMQKFTDMTDTFESTAQSAAKMNTVFGTSINSMELMLEQDPSKRLEMVRNQFKAQGKSWDSMNRQEKKFFADTMNLSEDEAAAVMTSGLTLEKFQEKQAKAAKDKTSAEDKIRKGLAATAETLFNFGQAWDK